MEAQEWYELVDTDEERFLGGEAMVIAVEQRVRGYMRVCKGRTR